MLADQEQQEINKQIESVLKELPKDVIKGLVEDKEKTQSPTKSNYDLYKQLSLLVEESDRMSKRAIVRDIKRILYRIEKSMSEKT